MALRPLFEPLLETLNGSLMIKNHSRNQRRHHRLKVPPKKWANIAAPYQSRATKRPQKTSLIRTLLGLLVACVSLATVDNTSLDNIFVVRASAQATQQANKQSSQQRLNLGSAATQASDEGLENIQAPRTGYLIAVGPSLNRDAIQKVIQQIEQVKNRSRTNSATENQKSPGSPRTTIVLHFVANDSGGGSLNTDRPGVDDATQFEDQLKLARYLTAEPQRSIRIVAWIDRTISNHSILPLLSSELIVASDRGTLVGFHSDIGKPETIDAATRITYRELAKQRGLFPGVLIDAITDADESVSFVTELDGKKRLAQTDLLREAIEAGSVIEQEVLTRSGEPLLLTAATLRKLNISSRTQNQTSEVAEFLDLAVLKRSEAPSTLKPPVAGILQIKGAISDSRIRRWQSNLAATMKNEAVNTWVLEIDSDGGALLAATRFANWLISPGAPIQTVAGHVTEKASADAALIALACKPLFIASDCIIGGPGLATPQTDQLAPETLDVIRLIASKTGRSSGLIQAIVNPKAEIYRFTHRTTGAVVHASDSTLEQELQSLYPSPQGNQNDDQLEADDWVRGEKIDLSSGVTARQAIELGLADSIAETTERAAEQLELDSMPQPVTDQALVRAVERLGSSNAFAILLLFIGFAALSAEFSSPGLGVPGFIALVCFSLYFWIKLLAGTAEWLELVALLLGITCIAMEFFVLPGFGIFGIGGFLLTGFAVILMSQTFVIPRNTYQLNALSNGVWVMLGGLGGLLAGLVFMRTIATKVPFFRALTMETPDLEAQEKAESIIDYEHLVGQVGLTSTPLHPSGKATFGTETIQVISDGMAIDAGQRVTVVRVRSNKVVVNLHEG